MLFSFLDKQLPKWSIGLDLGAEFVKFICLAKKGSRFQLMAHGEYERKNVEAIRAALQHPAIKSGDIRVSIEEPTLRVQKLDLPKVPQNEIDQVIAYSVKKTLKMALNEFQYRYYPIDESLGEKTDDRLKYIFLALENEKIEKRMVELKKLGFSQPSLLEPHINALSCCIEYNYSLKKEEAYGVIDIGRSGTNFSAVTSVGLVFNENLAGASIDAFALQLSREKQISLEEALEKLSSIIKGSDEIQKINDDLIRPIISRLCIKIQEAMDSFHVHFEKVPITKLLLTGGGSKFTALSSSLQSTFQIETSYLDPFKNLDKSRMKDTDFEKISHSFGVSVGLAL
jgi:type IV pilus assembly protein PilM